MKITDMIISDGKIQRYVLKNKELSLSFIDYCNNVFLFNFYGVTEIEEKGSVGYDLLNGKLYKKNPPHVYEFYDDEGVVLRIVFDKIILTEEA